MKTGKSLVDLAREIERQARAKQDVICDTRALTMTDDAKALKIADLALPGIEQGAELTELAHRQLGERLGIPARFYGRLKDELPDLLAENVNRLLSAKPERRMLRTLDGRVRAFLSDRYQRIDNNHVAEVVLPILLNQPGIEVVSAEITERKLYIKAVNTAVRAEVKSKRVGDVVEAGIMVSNSEIGLGAISVDPFQRYLACLNGMVLPKRGLRRAHIGTRISGDENIAELLADDTRAAEDHAVLLKVRDVVRAAMDQATFMAWIEQVQETTLQAIEGNPAKAVEVLANEHGFTASEQSSVLRHLIEGGDLSRYGLINAVTRSAEDVESYDRATELEALGGRLVELPAADWRRIAEAE